MYTRGFGLGVVVLVSVLGAASCGGDDTGTAMSAANVACDPVMQPKSAPHTPTDPCPQNEPQCPYPMYTAVTTCMPNGRWNPTCSCVLTSSLQGPQGGAGGQSGGATCGNGQIETGEQCDPATALPATAQCATLMPGTTGTVTCHPAGGAMACMFNTSMCMQPQMPPGGGAGG